MLWNRSVIYPIIIVIAISVMHGVQAGNGVGSNGGSHSSYLGICVSLHLSLGILAGCYI